MLTIKGITSADYFNILCEKCGGATKNEYLGKDPTVPRFKATCEKCGTSITLKLSGFAWKGLSSEPSK